MTKKSSFKRLQLFSFKLNALLEITQAINENLTIEQLLKRYEKILKEDLNIGVVLIFMLNGETWECLLSSGYKKGDNNKISVERDLLPYREITFLASTDNELLKSFDIIIPVISQDKPIAFVLIGDIDEEAEGMSPTIKHLHFIQTLSNIIFVAIENIRLFNESLRQEAIRKELELASKMQNMLIPNKENLPQNDHIKAFAFYHPHYDIGGDYYDCIALNQSEVGFCIADVSGKGISAAILMSNFQANLRALFTPDIPLVLLVEKLNERVMSSANGEKFITLFVAKYNYGNKQIEYINAGHNPPLYYEMGKSQLMFLNSGCVGMGMLEEIPEIKKESIPVHGSAKILCYTDGLVELVDESGVEFGTENIEKHIQNKRSISENIDDIIKKQQIISGSKSIFDDITILGIDFL